MYTHFVIHLSFLFRDEIGINFEFLKETKARSPSDNRLKKNIVDLTPYHKSHASRIGRFYSLLYSG